MNSNIIISLLECALLHHDFVAAPMQDYLGMHADKPCVTHCHAVMITVQSTTLIVARCHVQGSWRAGPGVSRPATCAKPGDYQASHMAGPELV